MSERIEFATWSELPSIRIGSGVGQEWVPDLWAADIFYEASERADLIRFCRTLEDGDFVGGNKKGDVFLINQLGTLGTRGGTLAAGTKVPITNVPSTQVVGTVREIGNGIEIEGRMLYLSPYQLQSVGMRWALAEDLQKCIDGQVRKEALTATTNYVYGGTWATIGAYPTALGTIGTAANFPMTLGAVRRLSNQFRVKKVPKINGQAWALLMHPDQITDLFNDAATTGGFVDITKYSDRQWKAVSDRVIGRIYSFDISESTFISGTTESKATGTVQCIDALAFGGNDADPSLVAVWAKPPEIRYEPDYQTDFQRTSAMAYLGDLGVRLFKDSYVGIIKTATVNVIEENNKLE